MNLASQSVEGGDSKYTITHDNKMPPGWDNGVTHSGPLNEMPSDGYLLAEEPGAGGAPFDGAHKVNTTKDGDTLHKVAS